jgi:leucyl aminopeptidase
MLSLLPDSGSPKLRALDGLPTAQSLAGLDALLLLLPIEGAPDRRLPDSPLWRALHTQQPVHHGEVRGTLLAGGCAAVVGYCRPDASHFEVLRISGQLVRQALALKPRARRLALLPPGVPAARRRAWQEALLAATGAQAFTLPSGKSVKPGRPKPARLERVDVFGAAADLDLRRCQITTESANLVRHLTALPPNVLDAAGYRRALATLARRHGLTLRWYNEKALAKLGAGAFLAVSRGNPARDAGIAHLSYRPRGKRVARPAVALVGKGVLFDTGGTNLKPHRSMLDMHTDMAGSAVALASLVALARLRAPLAADAWLAITENNIGPKAYRPQEVVRAANGTTIQIIHSDAEGRMVLADTLHLAARTKPALLVDYATLTGACVYALTERMSGVFTNRESLLPAVLAAGRDSGERVWPFPLDDDFDADIESSSADVAQCSVDGKGDHILAARFLKRFVPDATPWLHMDLAAATRRGGLAHVPTEITGFGLRYTLSLLLDQEISTS